MLPGRRHRLRLVAPRGGHPVRYERYGTEHTGMVCNLVTYRARSAVREVGYALGFPRPLVDRVAKALETYDSVMVRRDLEAEGGFAEFFAAPGPGSDVAGQRGLVDRMGSLRAAIRRRGRPGRHAGQRALVEPNPIPMTETLATIPRQSCTAVVPALSSRHGLTGRAAPATIAAGDTFEAGPHEFARAKRESAAAGELATIRDDSAGIGAARRSASLPTTRGTGDRWRRRASARREGSRRGSAGWS